MIIFLDIDWVLNRWEWLDRDKINILNNIVDESNAKIVISSNWRLKWHDYVKKALKDNWARFQIDWFTGIWWSRWEEIRNFAWKEKYIILDDNSDIESSQHKFLFSTRGTGLTTLLQRQIINHIKNAKY